VILSSIECYLDGLEERLEIFEEKNFELRLDIIEFIDFQVVYQIERLMEKMEHEEKLVFVLHRTGKFKAQLEKIDDSLFQRLRVAIQAKQFRGNNFRNLLMDFVGIRLNDGDPEETTYDKLDVFVNGLFQISDLPIQTKELEPGMIYFQKTPVRVIFSLIEELYIREEDLFFDLGSGLGQLAILVNLFTGGRVKGIEFEPAYCNYARNCAAAFNLADVEFINIDARKADYSQGTIFFLFSPFKDRVFEEVCEILYKESLCRKIKILSYGPCTAQFARLEWLNFENPKNNHPYKLGIFNSI
jgi:SAM-dependent methyltransferase